MIGIFDIRSAIQLFVYISERFDIFWIYHIVSLSTKMRHITSLIAK